MEQEVFVKAYEKVRPIVLKAFRQYFIQLWDQADMEQEAMMTLYQLLKKFPDLEKDDDKLRRYFKTKFRNRLNDEVRRQESVEREQLSSEDSLKLDRLLGGECFRGRKKMIRELRFWMVDFDPCNEED